ncbi:hypothetical protein QBC37DRAFT_382259 [Rhypophila decipiens]|uniref:Uncharacterized protein n=1 Tax=Rhypophila decipiens TaxID=261697 RepID=A0AAN6YJQ3_9PEZI|nr:hypothetical protein QBC37DRAFT_382259 [Rhypophila decipiens]
MSSAHGSPPPRFEVEYTPTPLDDDQPTGATDGVWYSDDRVVDMTEHLALYNATGDTAHITNLAAVCSEILGHQPAPAPAAAQPVQSAQARVDDRLHDRVVRRNKRRIARIFSGSYDTSIDDCKRAIKAFKPLALYRLAKHLHLARERGMRIPKRYHRIFLKVIFENESDGKFMAWDWEDDEVMSWLKMTYNDAKEQADYFGR